MMKGKKVSLACCRTELADFSCSSWLLATTREIKSRHDQIIWIQYLSASPQWSYCTPTSKMQLLRAKKGPLLNHFSMWSDYSNISMVMRWVTIGLFLQAKLFSISESLCGYATIKAFEIQPFFLKVKKSYPTSIDNLHFKLLMQLFNHTN